MARAPGSRSELFSRARALEGRTLADVAGESHFVLGELGLHGKGKIGALLEHVLGATAGSAADFDFPALEVELKTVPVDESGRPRESTYVCTLQLLETDRAEWSTSWVRRKLSRVLFVPIIDTQRIGRSVLFEPSAEQDAALKSDFDEIVGAIGAGGIEGLTAHVGECLQLRPKAAHGDIRTSSIGPEDGTISTVPRGFYLRARFVHQILMKQ
jgi:DNA mismatch repair protein MutH